MPDRWKRVRGEWQLIRKVASDTGGGYMSSEGSRREEKWLTRQGERLTEEGKSFMAWQEVDGG